MNGQDEILALALTAFSALEDAELGEMMGQIQERVFALDCGTLFHTAAGEDDVLECRLNPAVELLLHHITDIASQEELSRDERADEIRWALDISGF